jgi:hypothetical protein
MQAQEEIRLRVVRAIVEQGLSQAEACRTFDVGVAMDEGLSLRRRTASEIAQTGTEKVVEPERSRGGDYRADDHRPLSRSTKTPLCSLDARSCRAVDSATVGQAIERVDDRPVFEKLGIHAAEACATRLRTGLGRREAMAGRGLPGDRQADKTRKRRDSLGRRNGTVERSSGRHELRLRRTDPHHSRHWPAVSLQHYLDDHQSRPAGVYGVQAAFHCRRDDRVSQTLAAACQPKSISDH